MSQAQARGMGAEVVWEHAADDEPDRRFYSPETVLAAIGERGNPDIRRHLEMIRPVSVEADMLRVLEVFRGHQEEYFFPVLDERNAPLGLIRERELKGYVYSRYGQALLANRNKRQDVRRFLTPCPTVDIETSTERLLASVSEGRDPSEGIIVTDAGMYVGFLRLRALVGLSHRRQLQLIEEHNQVLNRKNNDIQQVLNNMRQGICTILPDLTLHEEYSAHLTAVLGTQCIAGRPVMELLFDPSELGADQRAQVAAAIGSILGEDELMFEMNGHLLVNELVRRTGDGERRTLELHWSPYVNDDGLVERLMLVVRDVSEIRGLQRQAETQRRELDLLGQILAASERGFVEFVSGAHRLIEDNRHRLTAAVGPDPALVQALYRNMHTIKGNARTLGLTPVTDAVHQVEQGYELLQARPAGWNSRVLRRQLDDVAALLEEYQQLYRQRLRGFASARTDSGSVLIDQGLLARLRSAATEHSEDLPRLVEAIGTVPLEAPLDECLRGLPRLARDEDRPLPKVDLRCGGLRVASRLVEVLRNVMNHILRNAVAHGLESVEERQSAGKPDRGTIWIIAWLNGGRLWITIEDDGRGLALRQILAKARRQGLISGDAEPDDGTVGELIFHPGLSTADSVSVVSGRGVGMDAVRRFLQEHGGDVALEFTSPRRHHHRSFRLLVSLPGSEVLDLGGDSSADAAVSGEHGAQA